MFSYLHFSMQKISRILSISHLCCTELPDVILWGLNIQLKLEQLLPALDIFKIISLFQIFFLPTGQ